jgi:hypothetical protein
MTYACDEARRRGVTVLSGTADEPDRARPFAAVSDPVEPTPGAMSERQRERLTGATTISARRFDRGI